MDKKLVSIIIPVFNCESTINRALESILKQSYKNIEIIVIDNGSTDNTLKIVNKYEKKFYKIKVFSEEKKGPSAARNRGIKEGQGDYLLFVDGDDYIDKNYIEEFIKGTKDKKGIFVFGDNIEIFKDREITRTLFNKKSKISKIGAIEEIASGKAGLVCSKLVDFNLIREKKIFFDESISVCEDQLFFLRVAKESQNFEYINKALYFYDRRNDNTITRFYKDGLLKEQKIVLNQISEYNIESSIFAHRIYSALILCINNEIRNMGVRNMKNRLLNIKEVLEWGRKYKNTLSKNRNSKINNLVYYSIINPVKTIGSLVIICGFKIGIKY